MKKELFKNFLIKYAEIGIKGKNRYLFEDALVARIQSALSYCEGSFKVRKTPGRIFVESESDFDFDETVDALKHVFGIVGICPIITMEVPDPDTLASSVVEYMKENYGAEICGTGVVEEKVIEILKANGIDATKAGDAVSDEAYGKVLWQQAYPSISRDKTGAIPFKMFVRRERKSYPKDSMVLNEDIGEALLNAFPGLKVDVHHPEMIVYVEIRDAVYIYSEIIPGPGGMPVGTGGHGMLLLSGGIDSPVAGYMVSKRGVTIDAVYFHAPPFTSERALQKVVDLATIISKYTGPINLHVINFSDIQMAIYEKCPHDELTIIMKRFMLRIAEHIAEECGAQGLITGESIGQVSSQTMASLICINEVATLPVIRPLIAFDKQDIVDVAEKIGSYETSIQPYEDCCTTFVAKHPVTKPSRKVIQRHEEHLNDVIDELLVKAYESDRIIKVGK